MRRKIKKIATYKQKELDAECLQHTYVCKSCRDLIRIGSGKGEFNCPSCGWKNEIK